MRANAIHFINDAGTLLRFDGVQLTPLKSIKERDAACCAVVPLAALRTHGVRIDKEISPEKLEIQTEMSMYEEAGLNAEVAYKIASLPIDLPAAGERYIESYAVESGYLRERFGKTVSKISHLDWIVPAFLRYEALYAFEKIERRNDLFIYLGETESYAVMFKDGHYISHRSIMNLTELAQKVDVDLPTLRTMLVQKGLESERYEPADFLKMSTLQQELSKVAERIAHAISHKRGIFGFDHVDRFYLDFDGSAIPGFLEIFANYGFDAAKYLTLPQLEGIERAQHDDALCALYLLGIVQGRCHGANLSIFERRPPFYQTHGGLFFATLAASALLALAYPLYALYTLEGLEERSMQLEAQVSTMESMGKKLQEKLKSVREERDALVLEERRIHEQIESFALLVDALSAQRVTTRQRQVMMEDINAALARYKLSSKLMECNATQSCRVQLISEYQKRDDIAKFMKQLLERGYRHVATREIRRDEHIYESMIEVAR
ncbi:MAG: hypothetical protein JXK05_06680 [Campylobacterales bacterium]|nr:hypothetical protein [Campylobacterales bacterium]